MTGDELNTLLNMAERVGEWADRSARAAIGAP
jgi:hypothetical protein